MDVIRHHTSSFSGADEPGRGAIDPLAERGAVVARRVDPLRRHVSFGVRDFYRVCSRHAHEGEMKWRYEW